MGSRDARRIQGPEKTVPFIVYQKNDSLKFKSTPDGPREDGRTSLDMQKMFMAVDVISHAKGSSFIEAGKTKVVCGVYGPKEVQRGNEFKLTGQVFCEVKFAPFSSRCRRSPQPDRQQREISTQLKEALESVIIVEKYPKAQIDVFITVIEDGGSLLGTCLTAAGVALCHASIDVYDLVVGSTIVWHCGVAYVEPNQHEEECLNIDQVLEGNTGNGYLSLGYMPTYAGGQVALLSHVGEVDADALNDGIDLAVDTSQRIYALAREALLSHVDVLLKQDPPDGENAE